MKKKTSIVLLLFAVILLGGCGKKDAVSPATTMDRPAEDGNYHYTNFDLKFSMVLPPEFIYYQTQRTTNVGFTDIEFFVPTSDLSYPQDIQSYAKPIIVRIYDREIWDEYDETRGEKMSFQKLGEKNDKVYGAWFWERVPSDWSDKWTEEMKKNIEQSFKIN